MPFRASKFCRIVHAIEVPSYKEVISTLDSVLTMLRETCLKLAPILFKPKPIVSKHIGWCSSKWKESIGVPLDEANEAEGLGKHVHASLRSVNDMARDAQWAPCTSQVTGGRACWPRHDSSDRLQYASLGWKTSGWSELHCRKQGGQRCCSLNSHLCLTVRMSLPCARVKSPQQQVCLCHYGMLTKRKEPNIYLESFHRECQWTDGNITLVANNAKEAMITNMAKTIRRSWGFLTCNPVRKGP